MSALSCEKKFSLALSVILATLLPVLVSSETKCSPEELRNFGLEYEQCHAKAIQKMQGELSALHHSSPSLVDRQRMICSSVQSLIEDCTVILGWCYTSTEVEVTKQKQRVLMQKALLKMFPDFSLRQCLKIKGHDDHREVQAPQVAEKAESTAPSVVFCTSFTITSLLTLTVLLS